MSVCSCCVQAARLVTTSVAVGERVRRTANDLLVEPIVREALQREAELQVTRHPTHENAQNTLR